MTFFRWMRFANGALIVALLAACASRGPAYDTMTADQLLQLGLDEKAERDWDEAVAALERFIFQYPTHERYQEARYALGEVYFERREYITAANEFARLATDFPAGDYSDDARFKVCESYYELSPGPQLDQEYTRGAIDHCQSLLAYYPDSEYAERARAMVAELTDKLADKLFLAGDHYYKRRAYDSAIQYFEDLLEQFPASAAAPKSLLRLYESYREIGYAEEAQAARERLLRDFPTSEEARVVRESIAGPR
jgi:outer membrane protein assembly factor BamD